MSNTKAKYGRSDTFYLLDDLHRISGDIENSEKYTDLLKKHSCTETKVVHWEECIKSLAKKIKKQKFDATICIGRIGAIIAEDLKKEGVELGSTLTFFVTRLSNRKWEKIAYINTPGHPSLKDQAVVIKKIIKKCQNIAIIDDVTYSGGTRKVLEEIIGTDKKVTAIDLITIRNAKKINRYCDKWISGLTLKEDPYPTINSSNQADVMNVSEFIYPSKNIGEIISGKIDHNNVLWDGDFKIFKKCSYTENKERDTVYFGKDGEYIKKETRKFQKVLLPLF